MLHQTLILGGIVARKPRRAAAGRHNRARLRKVNEILFANGIAAQPSLTKAIPMYKRLLAEKREKEKPLEAVKAITQQARKDKS